MAAVLTTDYGPHPAEKWAVTTAETIFQITPAVVGDRLLAAKRVQMTIAEALVSHHDKVQKVEHDGLTKNGDDHLAVDGDANTEADAALVDVLAAVKGSPWEDHFARVDTQAAAHAVLVNHFETAKHIHRSWYANPNRDAASWRAANGLGDPGADAVAWFTQHHPEPEPSVWLASADAGPTAH